MHFFFFFLISFVAVCAPLISVHLLIQFGAVCLVEQKNSISVQWMAVLLDFDLVKQITVKWQTPNNSKCAIEQNKYNQKTVITRGPGRTLDVCGSYNWTNVQTKVLAVVRARSLTAQYFTK